MLAFLACPRVPSRYSQIRYFPIKRKTVRDHANVQTQPNHIFHRWMCEFCWSSLKIESRVYTQVKKTAIKNRKFIFTVENTHIFLIQIGVNGCEFVKNTFSYCDRDSLATVLIDKVINHRNRKIFKIKILTIAAAVWVSILSVGYNFLFFRFFKKKSKLELSVIVCSPWKTKIRESSAVLYENFSKT